MGKPGPNGCLVTDFPGGFDRRRCFTRIKRPNRAGSRCGRQCGPSGRCGWRCGRCGWRCRWCGWRCGWCEWRCGWRCGRCRWRCAMRVAHQERPNPWANPFRMAACDRLSWGIRPKAMLHTHQAFQSGGGIRDAGRYDQTSRPGPPLTRIRCAGGATGFVTGGTNSSAHIASWRRSWEWHSSGSSRRNRQARRNRPPVRQRQQRLRPPRLRLRRCSCTGAARSQPAYPWWHRPTDCRRRRVHRCSTYAGRRRVPRFTDCRMEPTRRT